MNEQRWRRGEQEVVSCSDQGAVKRQHGGLVLLAKPVGRVEAESGVREGTTGRVVARAATMPRVEVRAKVFVVPRVWAVAEPEPEPSKEAVVEWGPALVPIPGRSPDHAGDLLHETGEQEAGQQEAGQQETEEQEGEPKGSLAFYRKYTEAMLRRYLRMSTEAGRVPSLLGRELFRGNVTTFRVNSFEDVVIFCHDMETLLAKLRPMDQQLIKRIALQQYSQGETGRMLRISLRSCLHAYGKALDRLTEMLLATQMLEPLKSCQ